MNGQNSPLADFLSRLDPCLLLPKLTQIVADYNKSSWRLFDSIRRLWITKVRYPLFRRMVKSIEESTADLLYNHPDCLIFVVARYFIFLSQYCQWIGIDVNKCLDGLFPAGSVYLNIRTEALADDTKKITGYEVLVRTLIPNPEDLKDRAGDRFAITRLEVKVDENVYRIAQTCYDTNDPTKASMAQVLFDKQFELQSDGSLYNPNYAFSKELFEEDLNFYRLMISQLMVLLGSLLESTTTIFFVQVEA